MSIVLGQRYGMLLVLEEISDRTADRHRRYRCLCDCGREAVVASNCIGRTVSCGCMRGRGAPDEA